MTVQLYKYVCDRFSDLERMEIHDWSMPEKGATHTELIKFLKSRSKTTTVSLGQKQERVKLAKEAKRFGLITNLSEVSATPVTTKVVSMTKKYSEIIKERQKLLLGNFKKSNSFLLDTPELSQLPQSPEKKRKVISPCGDADSTYNNMIAEIIDLDDIDEEMFQPQKKRQKTDTRNIICIDSD